MDTDEKEFATKVVEKENVRGPVNPLAVPIYASSTYELESAAHGAALSSLETIDGMSPWLYSRWGNPTADVAGKMITKIENGYGSFVTSSGMAAITTSLFAKLKAGDHVIAPQPVYGGTHEVFSKILPKSFIWKALQIRQCP
jgi:O-acetylhomoserine/O-acetylserine sulfhydrylase-like pyridoxal-dependent enzyme